MAMTREKTAPGFKRGGTRKSYAGVRAATWGSQASRGHGHGPGPSGRDRTTPASSPRALRAVATGALRTPLEAAGATTHLAPARWWARDAGDPVREPDTGGIAATADVLRRIAPDVVLS